jgi:outer membrane protein assembly factor BamD
MAPLAERNSIAMLLVLALCGCASSGARNYGEDDPDAEALDDQYTSATAGRGEASVNVTYAKTAQGNWDRAEAEFQEENYLAAQKYYTYIRAKFPYSAHALQADLRIADCLHGRGRFLEAIDAYQNFIRLHPTHGKVAYAMFKIGAAYFEQIPTDWFFLPPSHEKDQSAVRDAERALKAYVERYPSDGSIDEGKRLLKDVRLRLAAHERYAADFYANEEKPLSRVGRLEILRKDFADVSLDAALLLEIIEVRLELQDLDAAKELLAELSTKFPGTKELQRAERAVAQAKVGLSQASAPTP